jgi:hypothetical protein
MFPRGDNARFHEWKVASLGNLPEAKEEQAAMWALVTSPTTSSSAHTIHPVYAHWVLRKTAHLRTFTPSDGTAQGRFRVATRIAQRRNGILKSVR